MTDTDVHSTSLDSAKLDLWEQMAKNVLRAELVRQGWSFADLSEALRSYQIVDSELNLRNKVGRGKFSAAFMLQCMAVLGVEWLQIPKIRAVKGDAAKQSDKPSIDPKFAGTWVNQSAARKSARRAKRR